MPRGKWLTDEQRMEIYEARMMGESRREIASAYGITPESVTRIVGNLRRQQGGKMTKECIVAGNRKTGRLVSAGDNRRYNGTCIVSGRSYTKTFIADNSVDAMTAWKEWCNDIRTKRAEKTTAPTNETKETTMAQQDSKEVGTYEGKSVYVIWAKGEKPKLFGAYLSMDEALSKIDSLNEVASFLMNESVFEVDEVALKS